MDTLERLARLLNEGHITRREFLRRCSALGVGAAVAATWAAHAPTPSRAAGQLQGPVNYLGWGGHYELQEVKDFYAETGVKVNFTGGSENADMLSKIKLEGGKQYDVVSADALWVPKFYQEGLIELLPIKSWPEYHDYFDEFKYLSVWQVGDKAMAQGWAWSPLLPWYNTKRITTTPTSWEIFSDPNLRGRIAFENQPDDVMAYMGVATGAKKPYAMTKSELATAKAALKRLKPNILKFVGQDDELVKLMADESIWLALISAGGGVRIQKAGGPPVKSFVPKEGFIGYYDGDMLVKGAVHREAAIAWLQHKAQAKYVAANFLRMNRPLAFKAGLTMLLKEGKSAEAHARFYDQPELIKTMIVKGPPPNIQDYIDAFNEAIA